MKGQPQRSHLPPRILENDEQWHQQALCARVDPELFFPPKGSNSAEAKRICNHCEVTEQCRDYADKHNEPYGVWGGETWTERRMRQRRRRRRSL